jgi:hypothetical protein
VGSGEWGIGELFRKFYDAIGGASANSKSSRIDAVGEFDEDK